MQSHIVKCIISIVRERGSRLILVRSKSPLVESLYEGTESTLKKNESSPTVSGAPFYLETPLQPTAKKDEVLWKHTGPNWHRPYL